MKCTDLIAALRQLNPDLKPGQTIEDLLEMLKTQLYIDVTTPECLLEDDQKEVLIQTYIFMCVCIHLYVWVCVSVCVWERERERMCVREKLHVYIDIFSNRYTSYKWTWTHSCILPKSQRFTFTYMYTYFFISTCMYAFIYIHTCVYVCIFIRINTYRWVTAHVCLLCYSLAVWYSVCWQTCVEHHRLPTLDGDTGKCPSELWVFSVLPGVFLFPQPHYFLGLRAEKEITRARIVSYLELINGEKMKGQDRKRLLPRESGADHDEEMVDAWNATRGTSKRTRLQEHAVSLHIHAAAQLTTMRRWLTRATCQFLVTFHASAMSSSSSAAPLQHVFGRGVCSWTCVVIWSRFFPSSCKFASAFTSLPPRNCRTKSQYVCVCVCMCVCVCVCQGLCASVFVFESQWTHTQLDWPKNERGKKDRNLMLTKKSIYMARYCNRQWWQSMLATRECHSMRRVCVYTNNNGDPGTSKWVQKYHSTFFYCWVCVMKHLQE